MRMIYKIGSVVAALVVSGPLSAQIAPPEDVPSVVVRPNPGVTGEPQLHQTATSFIDNYFRHFSSANALEYFEQHYADHVVYYGKHVDRASLMREKARFVRRWPQRLYKARSDSIEVACDQGAVAVCTVIGLVDFNCQSPERQATSTGLAAFHADIMIADGKPRIIGEISVVLERS
jgi:hypothetical protein